MGCFTMARNDRASQRVGQQLADRAETYGAKKAFTGASNQAGARADATARARGWYKK